MRDPLCYMSNLRSQSTHRCRAQTVYPIIKVDCFIDLFGFLAGSCLRCVRLSKGHQRERSENSLN